MGTNQGDIATETPPAILPQTSFATTDRFGIDPAPPKSLKRPREPTPTSSVSNKLHSRSASPSKSARLAGQTSRHTESPPVPSPDLDEDSRWSEDDPTTREALETELASTIMASAPTAQQDAGAPPTSTPTPQQQQAQQTPAVPTALMAPPSDQVKSDVSPRSSTISMPGVSGPGHVTTSPEAMDIDNQTNRPSYGTTQMENRPSSSMSYPTIPTASSLPVTPNIPQRTATHPMPESQDVTPRSPSSTNKKHKCPFCDTDFTRHHNLKSHLLTHSQEKPYECNTCQMRFRRLHDLKRHSKLHTGEKPHICPKCDRKFARGDALARHSKGAGGCAGRRHSLPFDGDSSNLEGQGGAEGDESAMAGIQYEGSGNEVEMSEEDRQRLSMANAYATAAAAHSRTYPPAGARSSGLYPPNADRSSGNSGGNAPNSIGASHAAIATASLYAQNSMTESPKPLSPHSGAVHTNQTQNQHHVNHRPSEGLSLPSSHNNNNNVAGQPQKTPGLAGFAPPEGRYAGGPASGSHSRDSSGPNIESGTVLSPDQVLSYISSLESSVKQLVDRVEAIEKDKNAQISKLANEISALREHLAAQPRPDEVSPASPTTISAAPTTTTTITPKE